MGENGQMVQNATCTWCQQDRPLTDLEVMNTAGNLACRPGAGCCTASRTIIIDEMPQVLRGPRTPDLSALAAGARKTVIVVTDSDHMDDLWGGAHEQRGDPA